MISFQVRGVFIFSIIFQFFSYSSLRVSWFSADFSNFSSAPHHLFTSFTMYLLFASVHHLLSSNSNSAFHADYAQIVCANASIELNCVFSFFKIPVTYSLSLQQITVLLSMLLVHVTHYFSISSSLDGMVVQWVGQSRDFTFDSQLGHGCIQLFTSYSHPLPVSWQ